MARRKKKRDIGNPKLLYLACKNWRDEESNCIPRPNLASIWNRAVSQDDNGRRFRKHALWNYELALKYPD